MFLKRNDGNLKMKEKQFDYSFGSLVDFLAQSGRSCQPANNLVVMTRADLLLLNTSDCMASAGFQEWQSLKMNVL